MSFLSLLTQTWRIYAKHFLLFLSITCPFLILLLIRIAWQYSYIGSLSVVFTVFFGVLFFIASFFVEIMLIMASCGLIQSTANTSLSIKSLFKKALTLLPRYLLLIILITLITIALPLILLPVRLALNHVLLDAFVRGLMIVWIIGATIALLFSRYILVVEHLSLLASLIQSGRMLLARPFQILVRLTSGVLIVGIIFILLSTLTTFVIGLATKQTYLLTSQFSPWWQDAVLFAYAVISLPFLALYTSLIYSDAKNSLYDSRASNRAGDTRPA